MNSFLLDTNALISFVIERVPGQTDAIAERLDAAANLECELIITPHLITEFVYVLSSVYNRPDPEINQILKDLLGTPGLKVSNVFNFESLFSLWPERIRDFGDAIIAMTARELRVPILTFDRDFIKQLKREKIACETP